MDQFQEKLLNLRLTHFESVPGRSLGFSLKKRVCGHVSAVDAALSLASPEATSLLSLPIILSMFIWCGGARRARTRRSASIDSSSTSQLKESIIEDLFM